MKLKFRHKLLATPALATLFLLLILATTVWFGARNQEQLGEIETHYEPAVEVSRELEVMVVALQRGLQDAAAAEDTDALALVDSRQAAFRTRLSDARAAHTIDRGRADELMVAFDAYFSFARETTAQMIKKQGGMALDTALSQMTERFNALRAALSAETQRNLSAKTAAFEAARAAQRDTTRFGALLMLACVVMLVLVTLRTTTQLARPLADLTQAATRIAESGDLSTAINVESNDEVGELAKAFREMVHKLRSIPVTLKDSVGQLTSAVGNLADQTGVQTSVLQRQAEGLAEASATTQEIRQTSSIAASKAETVLQVALKAEELTSAGQKSVEASISGLQAIRTQVDQMVRNIQDLSERTHAVGEVIQRVKDLADQSNMLALNAAIEATKAGEYGRGFSVVAREIRSLADQSIQSTSRIREILGEIQTAIRGAVNSSQEGVRKVEEGMSEIRSSGENFRGITAIIGESSQAARQIVSSVTQQNVGIGQISTAISDLNRAMEQALAGVDETRRSTSAVEVTSRSIAGIVAEFRT